MSFAVVIICLLTLACSSDDTDSSDCSQHCEGWGYCLWKDGECQAGSAKHCEQSSACKVSGSCSFFSGIKDGGSGPQGGCGAGSEEDCIRSSNCKTLGYCKWNPNKGSAKQPPAPGYCRD